MGLLVLHGPDWDPGPHPENLVGNREAVELLRITQVGPGMIEGRAAVLVLDPALRRTLGEWGVRDAVDQGAAVVAIGAPGEEDLPESAPGAELVAAFVPHGHSAGQLRLALRTAFRVSVIRRQATQLQAECAQRTREIKELTRVGAALSTVHDYDELLRLILSQTRELTQSDAGSLYLVEAADTPTPNLRFKLAQNDTLGVDFNEYTMPLDSYSLAGHACLTGESLLVDDVYFLPPDVDYRFQRTFDERHGYRSKSMLTVPMRNRRGEAIGALQLINRKRDATAVLRTEADVAREVIPYSPRQRELVTALAGLAGISIENSRLYLNIEQLFEGFVQASVTAIEQRDPPTRGHSVRVANYTVRLAEVVDQDTAGPYRKVSFSRQQLKELRYAGLLHDFGKVGVREQVLIKEKKLSAAALDAIRRRQALMKCAAEIAFHRRRADLLLEGGRTAYDREVGALEEGYRRELEDLERFLTTVLAANEPTLLPEGSFEELKAFAARTFAEPGGAAQPLLAPEELAALSIRKGSLSEEERREIESHVQHTVDFLRMIPWTRELEQIPLIASGHHEKLNGKGYPLHVGGSVIPIQTRMMTICDIYDALAAIDRPYKKPVPVARALSILEDETKGGMLDAELFRLFVAARVYEQAAAP